MNDVVIGVCVAAVAILVLIAAERLSRLAHIDARETMPVLLVPEEGMRTQAYVLAQYGKLRCPFLLDTGFTGKPILNDEVVQRAAAHRDWNGMDLSRMVAEIESEASFPAGPPSAELLRSFGITRRKQVTRTIASLSGISQHHGWRVSGSLALGTAGADSAFGVDCITDAIANTGCIFTLDLMARLAPFVMDFTDHTVHTNAACPNDLRYLRQSYDCSIVHAYVTIAEREYKLIVDTGYSGAIAVNKRHAGAVVADPQGCDVLDMRMSQVDVVDNFVCASVVLAHSILHLDDGGRIDLGAVPVYVNGVNIDSADGLIGLEVLKRLTMLMVDTSWALCPRIAVGGLARGGADWRDAVRAMEGFKSDRCLDVDAPLQYNARCDSAAATEA